MEIYVQTGEQQTGPFSEEEVHAMVSSGQTMRSDLAWREGLAEWLPLEQVVPLPARPAPPPLPQGPPRPPAGLPPVPASVRPQPRVPIVSVRPSNSSSTVRTVSGVIALILGLLTIFNIGGCMNAKSKLARLQSGSDPMDGAQMFVQTFQGASQGDPLRGVSGMLDEARSLEEDQDSCCLGAWLCLVGTVIAGGVSRFAGPRAMV